MEENTKTRYSDEELEEFRGIINEMLDKARAEYATLRKVIMNAGGNDILDTAPTFKTRRSRTTALSSCPRRRRAPWRSVSTSSSRTSRRPSSASRTRAMASAA